ncbi:hypothetical protein TNCV_89971 [Trichonephila clavipes]|nr:hypothetical protein TNCV_89971 [Trichonephila clavipes]
MKGTCLLNFRSPEAVSREHTSTGLAWLLTRTARSVAMPEWMATTFSNALDSTNIRLKTSLVGTGRKQGVKITCGDWYPRIGCRTQEIPASGECTRGSHCEINTLGNKKYCLAVYRKKLPITNPPLYFYYLIPNRASSVPVLIHGVQQLKKPHNYRLRKGVVVYPIKDGKQ